MERKFMEIGTKWIHIGNGNNKNKFILNNLIVIIFQTINKIKLLEFENINN